MTHFIIINFVVVFPFIYIFTESHGIIFLICMNITNEEAQKREITNLSIIKSRLVSGIRSPTQINFPDLVY